ncbi:hypothetical protein OG455_29175 [Kitasatospora sp. NBC_01287]|uniref:hypothetical protein n=1 Tax=Kitasatospora sp. NBC_01287 TaxID=2903573 RepID=UPI0022506935|nr:hypothetical protein [Kitasatospora sp. NBC_01287]MCX4749535.1 hypothetical protein [Kitasatospora sp. NBC_01287]
MDENTTAEQLRRPSAPLGRRRRSLAAAVLLLSVAATVSACGSSAKSTAAGATASSSSSPTAAAPSSPATPSAVASPSSPTGGATGSSTAPGTAGTPTAPGTAPTGSPAAPGTPPPATSTPSAPLKPGAPTPVQPGGGSGSQQPSNPQEPVKPSSYLTKDNQLTVFFFGGVCDKYGLQTDESKSGQVRVQVVITQHAPTGQLCPALIKQQSVVGSLAHPLQGRAVVDANTGADIPLESAPNGGPVSAGN